MPLATTPAGKTFAIKALHPADSEIKTNRAPGAYLPTVALAFDAVDTIPFPVGATSACFLQTPNLGHPMTLVFYDGNGTVVDFYMWTNSAIGGPGVLHKPTTMNSITQWLDGIDSRIEAYRITAQSITCDVIAPAVADQGTIVSAQCAIHPQTVNPTYFDSAISPPAYHVGSDMWMYNDGPAIESLLMGTSAYTSKAKEGFYQPLKLDKFKFVQAADTMIPMRQVVSDALSYDSARNVGNFPIYTSSMSFASNNFPFLKPSGKTVGITYIEGTAGNPQVSLRVRVRQVAELVPVLGGLYAPLAEAPYPPDDLAFKMVREISQRMKDAYPASYNDKGTLLQKIKSIGSGILKFADPALDLVSLIPGVGNFTSGIRTAVKTGKAISDALARDTRSKNDELIPRRPAPAPPATSLVQQALQRGAAKAMAKRQGRGRRRARK